MVGGRWLGVVGRAFVVFDERLLRIVIAHGALATVWEGEVEMRWILRGFAAYSTRGRTLVASEVQV